MEINNVMDNYYHSVCSLAAGFLRQPCFHRVPPHRWLDPYVDCDRGDPDHPQSAWDPIKTKDK